MERRKFSRELKLKPVGLVKDRGLAVAQAARDLDLHENALRNGFCEATSIRNMTFSATGR